MLKTKQNYYQKFKIFNVDYLNQVILSIFKILPSVLPSLKSHNLSIVSIISEGSNTDMYLNFTFSRRWARSQYQSRLHKSYFTER